MNKQLQQLINTKRLTLEEYQAEERYLIYQKRTQQSKKMFKLSFLNAYVEGRLKYFYMRFFHKNQLHYCIT